MAEGLHSSHEPAVGFNALGPVVGSVSRSHGRPVTLRRHFLLGLGEVVGPQVVIWTRHVVVGPVPAPSDLALRRLALGTSAELVGSLYREAFKPFSHW